MRKSKELEAFRIQLGVTLQALRKDKTNYNQEEMGKKVAMSQKGISDVESGKTLANGYMIYMYCKLCQTEPNELFEMLEKSLDRTRIK